MKILVTGASGFLGYHLINKLLEENHEVLALLRNKNKCEISHDCLTFLEIDIDRPFQIDLNLVNQIDIVIHTAGIVHAYSTRDFYQTNTLGTKNLIKALEQNLRLKFIFISSLAARGPDEYFSKNSDYPVSHYGKSKKAAEDILLNQAPIEWRKIIVRPPMVIGPRDTAVLDLFKMVKGKVVLLPGMKAKSKKYSFVSVFDLVIAIIKCFDVKENALIYTHHPQVHSFEEIILEIQTQVKVKSLFYLSLPELLIKVTAKILSLVYKVKKHHLRLTPDKTKELFAKSWISSASDSTVALDHEYLDDLKSIVSKTYLDYLSKKWL